MKKLLSVVIALMMMVTFVFAEEAAPAEVKTLYAGVLTVGCEAGYPPFEMVADDGESVVGLDMDIMAAVAEKLGLQMQVVTTSFDGIDPSFFFDDNGKGYIVHNGPVVGGADYEGQRSIRCFEFDVKGDSIKGDFKEILRGGTHVEARPIWIEGQCRWHQSYREHLQS